VSPVSAFVAIDFETANPAPDSACAIGVVRAEGGVVVAREVRLIRPPSEWFVFTPIHGITWDDVRDAPDFAEVWRSLRPMLKGARFLAAHWAPFDRAVLAACCTRHGLRPPSLPFVCTVRLARAQWDIRPTKLPDVCRRLGLDLRHHEALSDALACAGIVLRAQGEGWRHTGPPLVLRRV
jgi:DNA polymerase-3 subunit epsilon